MRKIPVVELLLVLSALVNATQAYRIYQLTSSLSALKSEGQLQVGARVPPLLVLDADGNRAEVPVVAALPLIVYWMSPQCGWCTKNEANIRTLAGAVRGRYRIVALTRSAGDADDYDGIARMGIPVLGEPDAATARQYHFGGTPQTIVIGAEGAVAKVWTGAYRATSETEVERYFAVDLPGLPTESSEQASKGSGSSR